MTCGSLRLYPFWGALTFFGQNSRAGRTLAFGLGCAGGLTMPICLAVRAALTTDTFPFLSLFMLPGEASSSAPVQQQPEAGPSNQPLPVEPYPYPDTQVIGGDSVSAIQRRLLEKYPSPSAEMIQRTRIEAQDLFEVKVDIIRTMAQWDPTGDWMARGARALDNARTTSGEESLERLFQIWNDLQETGPLSDAFSKLQDKVRKRR